MTFNRRRFALSAAVFGLTACASAATVPKTPAFWRLLPTEAYPGKQDDISFVSPDIGW